MRKSSYHLDTCVVLAILGFDNELKEIRDSIMRHKNDPNLQFKVTHVVLGEVLAVLMRNKANYDPANINTKLEEHNVKITGLKDVCDVLMTALNILKKDREIEPNDLVIAAAAVSDPDCIGLITTDTKLVGNPVIEEQASKHNKKDFTVTENPFKKRRGRRRKKR